jgi:hypothetical protein
MRHAGRALAGLVVAAVSLAPACGGGVRDQEPRVGLADPGTPLGEGMMVPQESHLIGAVFAETSSDGALRSTRSVLSVEGDPFVMWDGLAYQAGQAGAPLPGSGICAWHDTVADAAGVPLAAPVPVLQPKPEGADLLWCSASAAGMGPEGEPVAVTADLVWSAEGAEVGLQVTSGGPALPAHQFPSPAPGPAPAGTAALLPAIVEPRSPRPGEPFGQETNCAEAGYTRLRLPDRAELATPGRTVLAGDLAAVLSVSDPHAALKDLAAQLDPTGPDAGQGSATIARVDAGYGRVWRLTARVSAGGGSCEAWTSPDGTSVLITMRND